MENLLNKTADYPEHPDSVIITKKESLSGSELTEKDIYTYYEGVKDGILKEIKGRNIFIRLITKSGALFIRHPFSNKDEYIQINNAEQFEEYHTGRILEFHITMPAMCPYYVVDFDSAGDWTSTKKITAEIADKMEKLPEVKEIELRFSGKRSFHIIGWLKKAKPIDKAREDLKAWLREAFGDRDDVVMGESPKGSKGALGVAPMKINGGQVALYSLRTTGLCCIQVPRASLMKFEKTDATPEKVYKVFTGRKFVPMEKKKAALRVINAFLKESGTYPPIDEAFRRKERPFSRTVVEPKSEYHGSPSKFAEKGEIVKILNKDGQWVDIVWGESLENKIKGS